VGGLSGGEYRRGDVERGRESRAWSRQEAVDACRVDR